VNSATQGLGEDRAFSPWLDPGRDCGTCAHSIGMDGPHLWCQRTRIVVVMPCGSWQREPGTDA
jgi:hypothetical protein